MSERKFKVGDRVRALKNHHNDNYDVSGLEGTIVYDDGSDSVNFVVEFDEHRESLHSAVGKCPSGRGLWLDAEHIELVKKTEFKKGDRVIGIGTFDNKHIDGLYGTVLGEKTKAGNYPIEFDKHIDGHRCNSGGFDDVCKQGHGWYVPPSQLKLANEDWKVVIIPEGEKTIGRLYKDNKVVKSVETTKHPDDEYSIEAACDVIMERLFEVKKEPPKATYYNGKVVCVKKENSFLTLGKIYEFKDGYSTDDDGTRLPCFDRVKSLEHLNEFMWSDFIEVVE